MIRSSILKSISGTRPRSWDFKERYLPRMTQMYTNIKTQIFIHEKMIRIKVFAFHSCTSVSFVAQTIRAANK